MKSLLYFFKYVNEFWSSTDDNALTKISADWAEHASVFWELKNRAIAFTTVLPTFNVNVTLKIMKFCCRLSLFVSVYFYRYFHTYKIPLPVNTNNFFYRYYWNYKIALPVTVILVLFTWRTGKTKTHILLFIIQHPRHFLIFDINLNKFALS